MSARIIIGQAVTPDRLGPLYVDVPTLIDTRALITGNSGAGKSRLLRRIAEQAFGHVQQIVLDPEGEFATLREKHAFLLAGRGGEIPAEPRAASLLARRLMELRVSAVVDLFDLRLPDRRAFVRLFVETLVDLPKDLQRPVLLMIDEAHIFAPEKSSGDAESTSAVIAAMTLGRKRGLATLLATQRLSKLHKDAAAEAKNVFVGGITLDVDQKRAADTLGLSGRDERIALRDIPPGEFRAYGPALSMRGVVSFTAGETFTTHPKAGQRHKIEAPAPPEAIRKVAAELKDLPQQAAEEIRTLQAAQVRVRVLERELREAKKAQPPAPPAPKAPRVVEKPVLKEAQIKRLEAAAKKIEKAWDLAGLHMTRTAEACINQARDARPLLVEIQAAIVAAASVQQREGAAAGSSRPGVPAAVPISRGRGIAALIPDHPPAGRLPAGLTHVTRELVEGMQPGDVGGGVARRMLSALAQFGTLTHRRLAMLARVTRGGSTWRGGMATLRANAWITEAGETATITDGGLAALGTYEPLPTGRALIDYWRAHVGAGASLRAFDALVAAHPANLQPEELARLMNVELGGSTWRGAMAKLRGLELIPRDGFYLAPELVE